MSLHLLKITSSSKEASIQVHFTLNELVDDGFLFDLVLSGKSMYPVMEEKFNFIKNHYIICRKTGRAFGNRPENLFSRNKQIAPSNARARKSDFFSVVSSSRLLLQYHLGKQRGNRRTEPTRITSVYFQDLHALRESSGP